MSKLEPKSLNYIFLGYSQVLKGYRFYCPSPRRYLVSADITFLENTSFSQDPIHTNQGEDDELLVYTLVLPDLAFVPPMTKPLITQVYAQCQHPPVSSSLPVASTSNPIFSDDLSIVFRKGKRQCTHPTSSFALLTICHHIPVLLLNPWTLFRCLTRFLKP